MVRLTVAGEGVVPALRASNGEEDLGLMGKIEKQEGQRMSGPAADSGSWHCFPHIGQVMLGTMYGLRSSKGD
jgi:hypothetical protein